jgi:1,4-alpha-glucan branching enzyme
MVERNSPVLMEQLADEYMLERLAEYIEDRIMRAEEDVERFAACSDMKMKSLALVYREQYSRIADLFGDRYNRNILGGFKTLQDAGHVEIITSAATHGYLPLLSSDASIYAQLKIGVDTYEKFFGRKPKGIWLPECGYRPTVGYPHEEESTRRIGMESFLEQLDIEYFFVDTHAIKGGKAVGLYLRDSRNKELIESDFGKDTGKTTFRPYYLENSNVCVFGRDERTGLQVWSGEWGYPGDGYYREFHKRDEESGFPYWRVTSRTLDLDAKDIYDPEKARSRVEEHSDHFVSLVASLLHESNETSEEEGILVAPYDIELFGHWWLEGVLWLERVLEKIAMSAVVQTITPSEYLDEVPPTEVIAIPESSWGLGGRHYIWQNPDTEWMWAHIHEAERKMCELVERFHNPTTFEERILNQAVRELLLLQSSDWPFLVTTQQAKEYASKRFLEHLTRFDMLLPKHPHTAYS